MYICFTVNHKRNVFTTKKMHDIINFMNKTIRQTCVIIEISCFESFKPTIQYKIYSFCLNMFRFFYMVQFYKGSYVIFATYQICIALNVYINFKRIVMCVKFVVV